MDRVPAALRPARVERFAREHPAAVLYDPARGALLDVASGKSLALDWARLAELRERKNAVTGRTYLLLLRDDGQELVLADVGLAFAPRTEGTGPLPGLPAVVCFRDLLRAEGQLTHLLLEHPDEEPGPAHQGLFLFCLAVVDGARAAGFTVEAEERRLERLLGELEARRRAGG
jgi:hypothetical protein